MTPYYECKYVISGRSSNLGIFREEGVASTLKEKDDTRTFNELRIRFEKNIIDGYIEASQPWRTNPKYLGLSDLKVELGSIEMVDEDAKQ